VADARWLSIPSFDVFEGSQRRKALSISFHAGRNGTSAAKIAPGDGAPSTRHAHLFVKIKVRIVCFRRVIFFPRTN
jgi:hypothetical protein